MIDQKMRTFVQNILDGELKIKDLVKVRDALVLIYGASADDIPLRSLLLVGNKAPPVELPAQRQPIGLGVEVKWSPDTVDNIIRERERKVVKPATEPGVLSGHKCNKSWCGTCQPNVDTYVKCSKLLAETLLKLFGLGYFRVNGVIAERSIIEKVFADANLPLKDLICTWAAVDVEIALKNLVKRWCGTELNLREETDKKAFRFSLVSAKADFEKAREAQAARNPPSPRKWDDIDTKGIEKKSPPMKNSFHTAESYNNIAERIFRHFGRDFTIDDVRDELHVEITAEDFARIRDAGSLRRCLRRVGRDGNMGVWRIV